MSDLSCQTLLVFFVQGPSEPLGGSQIRILVEDQGYRRCYNFMNHVTQDAEKGSKHILAV